jgi:hypothetical protein
MLAVRVEYERSIYHFYYSYIFKKKQYKWYDIMDGKERKEKVDEGH